MLRCDLIAALRLRALANYGRFWWHGLRQGRRVPKPKSVAQRLATGVGWIFCLRDLVAVRLGRPGRFTSRCA
jgi:hypothetical protein